MDKIEAKVEAHTTKRYTTEEEYVQSVEHIKKKSKVIHNKPDRRDNRKGRLEATVEDWEATYFTSPEKLLDETNYVMLISPLLPVGHSMKYIDGTAIVIEAPPRIGMLPYMQKPVLF